jgi:hypothetical protein
VPSCSGRIGKLTQLLKQWQAFTISAEIVKASYAKLFRIELVNFGMTIDIVKGAIGETSGNVETCS